LVQQEGPLARGGQLYRSADEGRSWTLMSTPTNMAGISAAGISRIFHSQTTDKSVTLFFLGAEGEIWVSKDRGVSYKHLTDPSVPKKNFHFLHA